MVLYHLYTHAGTHARTHTLASCRQNTAASIEPEQPAVGSEQRQFINFKPCCFPSQTNRTNQYKQTTRCRNIPTFLSQTLAFCTWPPPTQPNAITANGRQMRGLSERSLKSCGRTHQAPEFPMPIMPSFIWRKMVGCIMEAKAKHQKNFL